MPRFWEDTRIRVLPYDRGGMYFAVLNGKIGRASAGKRSIDDLIQAMIDRARAGQPVTEAVWLDLLRKEIGEDGPAVHRSMLAGGLMLPESVITARASGARRRTSGVSNWASIPSR